MRHPIVRSHDARWGSRLAGAVSTLAFAASLTLPATAQDTAPPPPPDVQSSQQQYPSDANRVRAVRLSDVEGHVQVFSGGQPDFDQAQQNMPVVEGMRLVTGSDGAAEVQFEDGSVARVTPNSSITLSQLQRTGDGGTTTVVDANSGLTYYELNGHDGQYSVRFGQQTVTPTDSSIFRINLDQSPEVAVTHGAVHVSDGQDEALDIHTNQSLIFTGTDSGSYDVAQSISADSWDQWNSDRDQALAVLGENATEARASTGSPDDPAWNDLDYDGQWYDVPGYGQGWTPYGVDAGWDPFGSGAWGYYSGIGYTWVSGYSWGWWPYHCGAWNYFNSFGWMWFPGNCGWGSVGAGWYPYATVWRTPAGYKLPGRPVVPPNGRPIHGPLPRPTPWIAVNRPAGTIQQFRSVNQPRPAGRSFEWAGQQVTPETASMRSTKSGPIGESFTSTEVREHPELFGNNGATFQYRSTGIPGNATNNLRGAYQPRNKSVPAPSGSRPSGGGGSRPSEAPHFSAPAPAPHASSGGSSGGGHPH